LSPISTTVAIAVAAGAVAASFMGNTDKIGRFSVVCSLDALSCGVGY